MSNTRSYAQGTTVTVRRSQFEIMELLDRFGVSKHAFMNDADSAAIVFQHAGLTYKISIIMPSREDESFHYIRRLDARGRTPALYGKRSVDVAGGRWLRSSKPSWSRWTTGSPRLSRSLWLTS